MSIEETLNYQALIIGGQEADLNEFPWTALLHLRSSETNRTSTCGGSLISDRHVLTAGHCIKDYKNDGDINDVWDDTTVVLGEMEIFQKYNTKYFPGEHDQMNDSETVTFKSKIVGVDFLHPKFYYRLSLGVIKYDIGLLTLETPIDFSNETFSHIR